MPSKLTPQKQKHIVVPKYDQFELINKTNDKNNQILVPDKQDDHSEEDDDDDYMQDLAGIQDTLKTIKQMNLLQSPEKGFDHYLQEEL